MMCINIIRLILKYIFTINILGYANIDNSCQNLKNTPQKMRCTIILGWRTEELHPFGSPFDTSFLIASRAV